MKTLTIVRHATAVARDEKKPDFARKLRKKGRKEAQTIAGRFAKRQLIPDLILTSAAPRAAETAEMFAAALEYDKSAIQASEELYELGDATALLDLIKTFDEKMAHVVIVGHDPLLSDFVHLMIPEFELALPKCAIAQISSRRKFWRNLQTGDGTLEFYEYPVKMPDKNVVTAAIRKEFNSQLQKSISTVFDAFHIKNKTA
ncbi:MAG: hypothetical protein DWQ10_12980, partial [Calditrichaeota bacterium]